MTVRHTAFVTCNQCGAEEPVAMDGGSFTPFWGGPYGWLTVQPLSSGFNFPIGTDTPEQARQKRPDLCSWECVSLYAQGKRNG